MNGYEQAALQVLCFLQGLYGFFVHDNNYECMMAYRRSLCSSMIIAVSLILLCYLLSLQASILFRFFLTTFLYIETHIYFQAQYWSPSSYNPKASSGGQAEASSPPFEEKDDKDVQA